MKGYRVTLKGKIVLFSLAFVIILFIVTGLYCVFSKQINAKKTVFLNNTVYGIQNTANKTDKTDTSKSNSESVDKPNLSLEPVKNSSTELATNISSPAEKEEINYPVEAAYFNDGKKIAFLTFDDGPSVQTTDKILGVLKNYNIKATFFIVGSAAEKNPDILKRVVEAGHSIGNHSYSHNYSILYSNMDTFVNEVKKTDEIIQNILGEKYHTRVFRFPGGSSEAAKQPLKQEIVKDGYACIDWNALSGDGEGTNIPTNKLYDRLVSTAGKQQHLVVLMHDSPTKQTTVEVLPRIIEYLKSQSYEFATLK